MSHPEPPRSDDAQEWQVEGADAAWSASEGDGDRLLDPAEVDSLLGAGAGDHPAGLEALIDSNTVSYERLPMLEVVFDRLVRILTTSLRNFTSENVELSLDEIVSLRFGDYLDAVPVPSMIAVFKAVEWDNHGLVTVDGPLIYTIIDVLLGGRRGGPPLRVEGRPFTSIERALVERLIRLVLAEMGSAFAPLSPVEFRHERLETNPRFAAIARPTNGAVLCRLRVEIDDRAGGLEILIPYATLEPVRDLLLQMFLGEKFGRDSIWEQHLSRQMLVTSVDLDAVLEELTLPLGDVMGFAIGTTVVLNVRPDDRVTLRCGQVPMLRGQVGRLGDSMAIRVTGRADDPEAA